MNRKTLLLLLSLASALIPTALFAQQYPAKPVRVISPYPPGASADIIGRIYAPKLTDTLGKQFVAGKRARTSGNSAAK